MSLKVILGVMVLVLALPAVEYEEIDYTPELGLEQLESFSNATWPGTSRIILFNNFMDFHPKTLYLAVGTELFINLPTAHLRDIEMLEVSSRSGQSTVTLDVRDHIYTEAVYSMAREAIVLLVLLIQSGMLIRTVRIGLVRPLEHIVEYVSGYVNMDKLRSAYENGKSDGPPENGGGHGPQGGGAGGPGTSGTTADLTPAMPIMPIEAPENSDGTPATTVSGTLVTSESRNRSATLSTKDVLLVPSTRQRGDSFQTESKRSRTRSTAGAITAADEVGLMKVAFDSIFEANRRLTETVQKLSQKDGLHQRRRSLLQVETPIQGVLITLRALENNPKLAPHEIDQVKSIRQILSAGENLFSPRLLGMQTGTGDVELQDWLVSEVGSSSKDVRRRRSSVESAAATSMRRKKLKSRTLSTLSLDATSQSLTLDIDQNDPERSVIVQLDRVPSGGHHHHQHHHHVKGESSDSSLYGDGKGDSKTPVPGTKSDTANAAQYSPLDVTKPPPLNLNRQSSSGSSVQGTPTPPGQQNASNIVPSGSMQPINTSRFHNAHSMADLSPRSRMKHLRAGSQPNLLKSDGVVPPSIFTPRPGALLMHVVPREALVRASRGTDLDDWNVDMFNIALLSDNHPLLYASFVLFTKFDLFSTFTIDKAKFAEFILFIEGHYYDNPYHNRTHAADVTMATNFLLCQGDVLEHLSDWEVLALFLSAIIHDVEHPGNTNKYEIKSGSDRAITYNDSSPLENHHLAVAFRCLKHDKYNILGHLPRDQYESIRALMIELVLSTDLKEHFKLVTTLTNQKEKLVGGQDNKSSPNLAPAPNPQQAAGSSSNTSTSNAGNNKALTTPGSGSASGECKLDSILLMKAILKMADIGHSSKRRDLHIKWTLRISEEFWHQGDLEQKSGLELSPFCDRNNPRLATSQLGFFDFIVLPLYNAAAPFFPNPKPVATTAPASPQLDLAPPNPFASVVPKTSSDSKPDSTEQHKDHKDSGTGSGSSSHSGDSKDKHLTVNPNAVATAGANGPRASPLHKMARQLTNMSYVDKLVEHCLDNKGYWKAESLKERQSPPPVNRSPKASVDQKGAGTTTTATTTSSTTVAVSPTKSSTSKTPIGSRKNSGAAPGSPGPSGTNTPTKRTPGGTPVTSPSLTARPALSRGPSNAGPLPSAALTGSPNANMHAGHSIMSTRANAGTPPHGEVLVHGTSSPKGALHGLSGAAATGSHRDRGTAAHHLLRSQSESKVASPSREGRRISNVSLPGPLIAAPGVSVNVIVTGPNQAAPGAVSGHTGSAMSSSTASASSSNSNQPRNNPSPTSLLQQPQDDKQRRDSSTESVKFHSDSGN